MSMYNSNPYKDYSDKLPSKATLQPAQPQKKKDKLIIFFVETFIIPKTMTGREVCEHHATTNEIPYVISYSGIFFC